MIRPLWVVTNRSGFGGNPTANDSVRYYRTGGDELAKLSAPQFQRDILTCLRVGSPSRIVAVIHGFNVRFQQSIDFFQRIDARITRQLSGQCITVGFSWPSSGLVTGYLGDRWSARRSAEPLAAVVIRAIRALEAVACPAEMYVVAHSMGSYLLARATREVWVQRGKPESHNVFSEVVMVAPDLDANELEPGGVGEAIAVFARRVTVYASRRDGALLASSVKRGGFTGARLGRRGPEDYSCLPPHVVHVDATESASGHSAHFESEVVLSDIRAVLSGLDRDDIAGRVALDDSGRRYRIGSTEIVPRAAQGGA